MGKKPANAPIITNATQPTAIPAFAPVERPPLAELFLDVSLLDVASPVAAPADAPVVAEPPVPAAVGDAELAAGVVCVVNVIADDCEEAAALE